MSTDSRLPYELYEQIIDTGLEGWKNGGLRDYLPLKRQDLRTGPNLRFLATCCLVSREWSAIARKRLYAGLVINWRSVAYTLRDRPHLSALCRYLFIDAPSCSMFFGLTGFRDVFPNLEAVSIVEQAEDMSGLRPYINVPLGASLTHLLYIDGTTAQLVQTLSHMPSLKSLHVRGARPLRLRFGANQSAGPAYPPPACHLRELVLQSVYHYDVDHLTASLANSIDSLESVAIAHFGSVLNDILPSIRKTKKLALTVKSNPFGVTVQAPEYQIERILEQFERLEELTFYATADWKGNWPDDKHAAIVDQLPHVKVQFIKGVSDFVSGKVE